MDLALFKKIIYDASKQVNFDVIELLEPEVTPNFYVAWIKEQDTKFVVLASFHNDWSFAAEYEPLECQLNFINNTKLATMLLNQYDIRVLSKEELNEPFETRAYLDDADSQYWKPKTLGEGLFNWWD